MKSRIFLVLIFLLSSVYAFSAQARKPAVEDFVGVETEDYKPTTQGTEVLFDFGNHIKSAEKKRKEQQESTGKFAGFILAAFILLPFFMWKGITNSLKKEDLSTKDVLGTKEQNTAHDNIAHLSDYQSDKSDDDIKKAS